jgi:hypothetical protein
MANLDFVFKLLPPELTDTFVVFGCSAGGLAVMTWVDYIADRIHHRNPNTKVFGLADSGFLVDYPSFQTGKHEFSAQIKAVVEVANQ